MKKLLSLIAIILTVALTVSNMVFSVSAKGGWNGTATATEFTSGNGTEEKPYIISTPEQLLYFANLINDPLSSATYSPLNYKLGADLDLNGQFWYRIGIDDYPFRGVFDGDGHTISNYVMNDAPGALFGLVANATVKNLRVDRADIVSILGCGAVFVAKVSGKASLTIENCEIGPNVKLSVDSSTDCARVGGFWGDVGSKSIIYAKNCINRGTITVVANGRGDAGVGGMGGAFRYGRIENCVNLGSIVSTCTGIKTEAAGGIIGVVIEKGENPEAIIQNVINCADITGYTSAGGIIGTIHSGTANLKITNAYSLADHVSVYADETMALGAGTLIGSIREAAQTCTLNSINTIAIPNVAQIGGAFTVEGTAVNEINTVDALVANTEYNAILASFGIDSLPEEETDPETEPETDPEVETNAPETNAPETNAPGTDKPEEKGGCGSVVAGGLAILAVVALAGVALKKRD